MKPGSSQRCPAKHEHLRCNRRRHFEGRHQAKSGRTTVYWT